MSDPAELHDRICAEVGRVLIGKEDLVTGVTISLLTRGHVLLEGVPGVAKTTLANLFARTLGLDYSRIQMTPDILPADITGTHVYQENTGEFSLQRGPVFANIVVADEINRATPKTQSALLEAMQERQVTIEGETLALPSPFLVIATQNPIELEGTFELPEAQRDRFQMKLNVDLPSQSEELELLDRFDADPELSPARIEQVVSIDDLQAAQEAVATRYVDREIKEYILELIAETRSHPDIEYGASPRASIALLNTAKANAAIEGRAYVIPDDVKQLAEWVMKHRLVLNTDAELSERSAGAVVTDILETVQPPGSDVDLSRGATADGGQVDPDDNER